MLVLYTDTTTIVTIVILLVISLGLHQYKKELPFRKKIKLYNTMFEEIKLYSKNKELPIFLEEDVISDYVIAISFKTLNTLSDFYSRKDLMEVYINKKIIDIRQDKEDNQIIYILIQEKPLPESITFDDAYVDMEDNLLNIGVGYYGIVSLNLEKYPHVFIAGETGSGKSNILKCMIYQSLVKEYDVILIDFKRGVSFSSFSDVVNIYYDYVSAKQVLEEMVIETNKRLDLFRKYRVDNINDYNNLRISTLNRKIVFIDELAELLKTRDKELSNSLYDSIETLTRLSRAVGIHLIMGIQRPDSTIINGQIKNNVSFRICGRFVDKEPSRIMLATDMASNLPNIKGRFLVKGNDLEEVQCFYYTDRSMSEFNNKDNLYKENDEYFNFDYIETESISVFENAVDEETTQMKEDKKEDIKISNELIFDFSDIQK